MPGVTRFCTFICSISWGTVSAGIASLIKPGHNTFNPGLCQIGFDPFFQSPEPMPLAIAANAGQPSITGRFQCDARSDSFYLRLQAFKIPFGSKPDNTTTIRTAIKLKQKRLDVAIKNSFGKTMAPEAVTVTTRTGLRLLPWLIALYLSIDSKNTFPL